MQIMEITEDHEVHYEFSLCFRTCLREAASAKAGRSASPHINSPRPRKWIRNLPDANIHQGSQKPM
jgi:hypothetical protein